MEENTDVSKGKGFFFFEMFTGGADFNGDVFGDSVSITRAMSMLRMERGDFGRGEEGFSSDEVVGQGFWLVVGEIISCDCCSTGA